MPHFKETERIFAQGGPFDVIVDDGGHSMKQQITTLRTLFPKLPPGGIFILEDLLSSFFPESMGGVGHGAANNYRFPLPQ